jgi:RNA polymerase sigma-70 factor, ECF subfamily
MSSSAARKRSWRRRFNRLLAELADNQNGSLLALLNLYRPYLLATARARLEPRLKPKAGPSDLVQETLVEANRAWQVLDEKPRTEEETRLWLRNILFERLKALRRRYYRAQSRSVGRERSLDQSESRELLDELVARHCETPRSIFDRKTLTRRVEDALKRLSPAYRQVILWRSRDGRPFAEIGARMERSADAARMLWRRAILQLKKELEGEDGTG